MLPDFPIYYFLIPYAILMAVFLLISFFNTYHLLRYGVYNFNLYILSTIYMCGVIFILGMSWIVLSDYDWTTPFPLSNLFSQNLGFPL